MTYIIIQGYGGCLILLSCHGVNCV